jgi:uncharacterized protein (UPF0335 family)
MTDAKLKSYVDRIERLEEERKAIGGDVRDIYTEAKGNRYNPKALRKIIAMRRQKVDPVVDAEVEAYKAALGMAVEMVSNGEVSLRKAAKATGVSKSSIHRALAVPAVSHDPKTFVDGDDPAACGAIGAMDDCSYPNCDCHMEEPHDPKTGEVHGAELQTQSTSAEDHCGDRRDHPPVEVVAGRDAPAHTGGEEGSDAGGVTAGECGTGAQAPLTVEMGHPASSTDAPPDDLAIPPYLDRRHERVRG